MFASAAEGSSASRIRRKLPVRDIAYCPWWGRFGGVNDRFAIMGWSAAFEYHTTYDKIPSLLSKGCPFHPESLVAASMAEKEIRIKPLQTEFSTYRIAGDPRPHRPPEISAGDIADLIISTRT